MADYTWRVQSELSVGDQILSADLQPATIVKISHPPLNHRSVCSFEETPDVRFLETDSLWAKQGSKQWWWVENVAALHRMWKLSNLDYTPLKTVDSFLVDYSVKYATVTGWESKKIVDVTIEHQQGLDMTFLTTDRYCPVIINGHVVSSGLNEYRYDYTAFNWDRYQPTLKQRLLDNNTLIF
jgi:hypothetical protein